MAKPRVQTLAATKVELSASARAVITADEVLIIAGGRDAILLTRREAEVLAAVVGTGRELPKALRNPPTAWERPPRPDPPDKIHQPKALREAA